MNKPWVCSVCTHTYIFTLTAILSYFHGLSCFSIKMQRLFSTKEARNFPRMHFAKKRNIQSWFHIFSAEKGGLFFSSPFYWSESWRGHLLLSGLKSPGGMVSARGGKPCAELGADQGPWVFWTFCLGPPRPPGHLIKQERGGSGSSAVGWP